MQNLQTHSPPQFLQEGQQVFIVMSVDQFNDMMSCLHRIAVAVENKPEPREATVEDDNYGINPNAIYTDSDLRIMLDVCEKTTYRWRHEGLIEYQKGACGITGSKIWYFGRQIIDFYRRYAISISLNPIKRVEKEIPKGHV